MGCILLFAFGILYRFTDFGGPNHQRPAEDLAFAVARFIQKGGSLVNYYMVSLPTLPFDAKISLTIIDPTILCITRSKCIYFLLSSSPQRKSRTTSFKEKEDSELCI